MGRPNWQGPVAIVRRLFPRNTFRLPCREWTGSREISWEAIAYSRQEMLVSNQDGSSGGAHVLYIYVLGSRADRIC